MAGTSGLDLHDLINQVVTINGSQIPVADYLRSQNPTAFLNGQNDLAGNGSFQFSDSQLAGTTPLTAVGSDSTPATPARDAVALARSNPMTQSNNLAGLTDAISLTMGTLKNTTDAMVANAGMHQSIQDVTTSLYTQSANDAATIENTKNLSALHRQQANNEFINRSVGTSGNVSELINKLMDDQDSAYNDRAASLKEITAKQTINPLTDPLGYVMARLTINQDIARHNDANERVNATEDRIQQLNTAVQQSVQTQNLHNESLTAATIDASTRQAAAAATLAAQTSQQQGIIYNSQGLNAVKEMSKEQLDAMFKGANLDIAKVQLQTTLDHLQLSRDEFSQRKEQFEWQKDEKLQSEAGMKEALRLANIGFKNMGLPEIPGNGKTMLAMMKLAPNGKQASEFQIAFQNGEAAESSGIAIIGTSPGNSANVLNTLPVKIAPIQQPIKTILSDSYLELINAKPGTDIAALHIDLKNPKAVELAVTDLAKLKLSNFAGDVTKDVTNNPYTPASVNSLAAVNPVIADTALWKTVLEPKASAGFQYSDPKVVVQQTMDAVIAKKISYNDALDGLTTIAHVSVASNIAARGFASFGIVPSESMNVPLAKPTGGNPNSTTTSEYEMGSGFSTKVIVDLAKPDQVSRYMNMYLARQGALNLGINASRSPYSALPE